MGLFDFFKSTKLEELTKLVQRVERENKDLKATIGAGVQRQRSFEQEVKQRRRTLNKPIHYATPNTDSVGNRRLGQTQFYGPLHDLGEIGRAIDIEPYITVSIRKHREQILKEGWSVSGEEQEMVDYIEQRLFDMVLISGV
ncbi:MAG: hypothetical protein ACXABY_16900, partial [Candidatus Thorarchaeota archaeon]